MATKNPIRQRLVSTVAALERHHPDDPRLPSLRAELVTEALADRISRATRSTLLTPAQQQRLVLLIGGTGHDC